MKQAINKIPETVEFLYNTISRAEDYNHDLTGGSCSVYSPREDVVAVAVAMVVAVAVAVAMAMAMAVAVAVAMAVAVAVAVAVAMAGTGAGVGVGVGAGEGFRESWCVWVCIHVVTCPVCAYKK